MSELVVLTLDAPDDAEQILAAIRSSGEAAITDSAVISRDAAGELHLHEQIATGTSTGAIVGGGLGLLLGIMFPPIGLALAAVGGAAAGAYLGHDLGGYVDGAFVKDVEAALAPGTSALFLLLGSSNLDVVSGALRGHHGKVYQTTLDPDAESSLMQALGQPS